MKIEHVLPEEIEKRSFAMISEELEKRQIVLPRETEMVTKRVIHTSADFEYAKTLVYSPNAVEIAKELIKKNTYEESNAEAARTLLETLDSELKRMK